MNWKQEIEKLLRDQMPYAYLGPDGNRVPVLESSFQDALGYITELVYVEIKNSYIKGYQQGAADAVYDLKMLDKDSPAEYSEAVSRIGAERAFHRQDN